MSYRWEFQWVYSNASLLWRGMLVTVALTVATVAVGWVVSFGLIACRLSPLRFLPIAARCFVEVFRNLPVLVVLVWLYFCLPLLIDFGRQLSSFWIAVIGLSINYAALQSEILYSAFKSIPSDEIEAARAMGFSRKQILGAIVIPQAFWRSLAPSLGQAVNTLKLSSLASFIAVPELFYITNQLIQQTFRPLEFYTALAACYLLIITPISVVVQRIEATMADRFFSGGASDSAA